MCQAKKEICVFPVTSKKIRLGTGGCFYSFIFLFPKILFIIFSYLTGNTKDCYLHEIYMYNYEKHRSVWVSIQRTDKKFDNKSGKTNKIWPHIFSGMPIQNFRVAGKNGVGQETRNKHIFSLGLNIKVAKICSYYI